MTCPVIQSDLSHLHAVTETTWGTLPGSPTYIWLPVSEYGVTFQAEHRKSQLFVGNQQEHHSQKRRGMPQGSLSLPFFGWRNSGMSTSLAQFIYDWGFSIPTDGCNRASKVIEWAEGPDLANRRHLGLRVNQITLAGDEGSGQVTFALDLMGKTEATFATAQTVPNATNQLMDQAFENVAISLGGSTITARSFSFVQNNNLSVQYENSFDPTYIIQGTVQRTLTIEVSKEDDTYAALHRAATEGDLTGQLVLTSSHEGTGTGGTDNTVLTIDFNLLRLQSATPSFGLGQIATETLEFAVLKPTGADEAVDSAWTET